MKHLNAAASHSSHVPANSVGYVSFVYDDGREAHLDQNSLDLYCTSAEKLPPASQTEPSVPLAYHPLARKLVIDVTHSCNLACKYCYLREAPALQTEVIPFAIAKNAIDTLVAKPQASIAFFGGEALLGFDRIREIVAYAEGQLAKPKFGITTNGTLITSEIAAYLASKDFAITVSLDGDASLHDAQRVDRKGKATHASVMQGLQLLRDAGAGSRTTLRSTFRLQSANLLPRTLFLTSLCDQDYARNLSVEPVCFTESRCADPSDFVSVNDVLALENEYVALADYLAYRMQEGKRALFHNVMYFVNSLLQKRPKISECGAGTGYLSVSPAGGIHACHRQTHTCIGSLAAGINERARAKWIDNRVYASTKCCACSLRFVCGGACREQALASGDISVPSPVQCAFRYLWIKSAVRVLLNLAKHASYTSSVKE